MDIHCSEALYFVNEKTNIGLLTQLALDEKTRVFTSTHIEDQGYSITFGEYSFLANLKNGKGRHRKKLFIDGCVTNVASNERSFFDDVNINGKGYNGWELRPPQRGAIYGLLAHWSLSNDTSTVVLPTGTGKTETMLVVTLVDRAAKTLVIVPTIELKQQISEKFGCWGILRKLGVIPN